MTTLDRTASQAGVRVLEARTDTRAVVLVLHGGKEHSVEPSQSSHLSSLRMRPFARALHRAGADEGVAVWSVKYRVRGWNGRERSPVQDALWALSQVRHEHGDVPVVLVGHSMGGRTAVHVLGEDNVTAAVLLAPWLPDESVDAAAGRDVVIIHGVTDTWTNPHQARDWADRARPVARSMLYVGLERTEHFMVRRARLWTKLAVAFALQPLGIHPSANGPAAKVLDKAARGATTLRA